MTPEQQRALALARARLRLKEQNVVATTPDGGRVVRMQDGSLSFTSPSYSTNDQDAIARIMEGDSVKRVVQSTTDRLTIGQNPVAARVNEFNRGTPFIGSWLDEAVGAVSPEAGAAMRQTSEAMQRERAGETAALNIGGAVAGSVPLALAGGPALARFAPATPAARVGGGVAAGAVGGGTEGTIYGYGEGTGAERGENAQRQGAFGAAVGGALGGALPLAGGLVENLARRWKGEDVRAIAQNFDISTDSARVLKQAFENNDTAAADRILRAGSEATLADAGRSGQALLDAAAQTGGRPLNIVDSAVGARTARSMPRVNAALDETLGPVRGPRAAAREVAEQSRPARQAAYDRAYNMPIDYSAPEGREIEGLLKRLSPARIRQAAEIANERLRWDGGQRQILIDMAEDGSVSFREMPGVRQLDALKRALNQIDQSSRDGFGRATDGGLAADQARAVRDATVRATGGDEGPYAAALRIGGDKVEMDRGLQLGLDMLRDTNRTTREIVGEELAGMSADARNMVRLGLRSYIDETLGRVKMIASAPDSMEARQAMQALRLLTTDNAKSKLRALLGKADYDRLMPQLDEAIASQNMAASVAGNSRTAIRGAIQGRVNEITEPGVVGRAARGQPVDATQSLVQELLATTPGDDAARKEQIWSEIAQVLSQRRGNRSAQAALKYIEDAIAGNPLTEAQARLIANQFLLGVQSGGTASAQRLQSAAR